jgi:hypothetical protein
MLGQHLFGLVIERSWRTHQGSVDLRHSSAAGTIP